jgi:hypothetical protein
MMSSARVSGSGKVVEVGQTLVLEPENIKARFEAQIVSTKTFRWKIYTTLDLATRTPA